jgi:hypothetical protein
LGIAELNELIGYDYPLSFDWGESFKLSINGATSYQTALGALRDAIPASQVDDVTLVKSIGQLVTSFLQKLRLMLSDESSEFQELFLEKTESRQRQIAIKVHPLAKADSPFTRFTDKNALELYFPHSATALQSESLFGDDLEESVKDISSLDPRSPNYRGEGAVTASAADILPSAADLPRPEIVMNTGPIYLRITESRENYSELFQVEGYQPCVDLIYDYLGQYVKERNSRMTMWRRSLRWGENLTVLHVSSENNSLVGSPLLIIKLVKQHLGFQQVGDVVAAGNKLVWHFEREKEFVSL